MSLWAICLHLQLLSSLKVHLKLGLVEPTLLSSWFLFLELLHKFNIKRYVGVLNIVNEAHKKPERFCRVWEMSKVALDFCDYFMGN